MEEPTVTCPVCDGDGEFLLEDDVIFCPECGGTGFISKEQFEEWWKEMKFGVGSKELREQNGKELQRKWKIFLKEQKKKNEK